MSLSTEGLVILVLLVLLFLGVTAVIVFLKCRSQKDQCIMWIPSMLKKKDYHKHDESSSDVRSTSSHSPLFDRRHSGCRLVIPMSTQKPRMTTIRIPVVGTRRLSDTSSSSSESSDHETSIKAAEQVDGAEDEKTSVELTERDSVDVREDGVFATAAVAPEHGAPEMNSTSGTIVPKNGPPFKELTLESGYEETVYSVYRQEKEVLQSASVDNSNDQDQVRVVDNHLLQQSTEKKKKHKSKRKGLSVPHLSYRRQNKDERRASSQLLYEATKSINKGRAGSADNIIKLGEVIGKLFLRIQHNSREEKLLLFIDKVTDLELPACVKVETSLNPVLYVRGGFLPTMGQRFITKHAAVAEEAVWCNEFALVGVSKTAAWQLTIRLHLCYRESSIKRTQIIGVCDVVLGQMILENSQDVVLNFISIDSTCIYSEHGDLHLSVCYQPSLQRVVFLVLEARDLPRSALFGTIHSVTKIEMFFEGKRVEKQKSRVVKETVNPAWNDQVVFTIPHTKSQLEDVQFDVTVMHVDMVKGAHTIGKCELGWTATCEELGYWKDVMQNPNRPIPMWLSLQYPD